MSFVPINNCEVTYSDFSKTCRLCLATNETLRNMLQKTITLLKHIADIQISEDDELPKGICNKCTQSINDIINFINYCKRNDQILKNVLSKRHKQPEPNKINNKTCHYSEDHHHSSECNTPGKKSSGNMKETTINQNENIHPNQTLYKCTFCPKQFKFKSKIKQHTHRHQIKFSLTEKNYKEKRVHLHLKCQTCGKIFSSRSGFHYHKLKHEGKVSQKAPSPKIKNSQRFLCNYCGKSLNTKSNLDDHLRVHTGENPFKCNYCSKEFRQKSALNRHHFNHLDKRKLFICKTCAKEFTTKAHRDIHMRIHTGEKPYKCEFCQKQFNYKTQWRIHQRLHTGETPFVCNTCNNAYHDKGSFRKHQKNKSHFLAKSDCSTDTNQESKKRTI